MSFDELQHRPMPDSPAIGAKSIAGHRVRVMIRKPQVAADETGRPLVFHELSIADAVQMVQALRQAINDARKGRVR